MFCLLLYCNDHSSATTVHKQNGMKYNAEMLEMLERDVLLKHYTSSCLEALFLT
jgi:hypothetical protein